MEHYHLNPSAGILTLTREGSRKVLGEFESKSEALAGSTRIMKGCECSLKIHKEDGTLSDERYFPAHEVSTPDEEQEARWEEEPMPGLAPYTFK